MSTNFFGLSDQCAKKLSLFTENSRNFARTVNNNSIQNIFHGNTSISDFLTSLGSTEHDMKSFTIDVTKYTVALVY